MTKQEKQLLNTWSDFEKRNGLVPAAPIIELIDKFLAEQEPSTSTGGIFNHARGVDSCASYSSASTGTRLDTFGPEAALVFRLYPEESKDKTPNEIVHGGVSRRIRALREQKCIGFDLADRIVTKLGFGWRGSPLLEKLYNEVNLTRIDLISPTSPIVEEEIAKKTAEIYATRGRFIDVQRHFGIGEWATKTLVARSC